MCGDISLQINSLFGNIMCLLGGIFCTLGAFIYIADKTYHLCEHPLLYWMFKLFL